MQRRSFLATALATIGSWFGIPVGCKDNPPEAERVAIYRWDGQQWRRVRMHELRAGDAIIHEKHPGKVWHVKTFPEYLADLKTWHVQGIHNPDDPIQSLPRPARL